MRVRRLAAVLVGVANVAGGVSTAPATAGTESSTQLEFLGEVRFPTGHRVEGTEMGGLSGLAHDGEVGRFLALSDDRSQIAPARYYDLTVDLSDGDLAQGDIRFTGVTTLHGPDGDPYSAGAIDPEGIEVGDDGDVLVSSEGDASEVVPPFVNRYDARGRLVSELPVPEAYVPAPDGSSGVRDNLALESLTATPSGRRLVTATENALVQDGGVATRESGSRSRILVRDTVREEPFAQYVYETDPIPDAPVPADGFADNGVSEMVALDRDSVLVMERAYAVGVGNNVRIHQVDLTASDRVRPGRAVTETPAVSKILVADIEEDFGVTPDNLEGMALGPVLPDGRRSLLMVSDNNFSGSQVTQFLAFALEE